MKITDHAVLLLATPAAAAMMTAVVYRGPSACDGCPEGVAKLLKNSPYHFNITYVGPDEDVDLSPKLLSKANVFAYPGGPDVDEAWEELEKHAKTIRDFVHGGGRYMGFCLGAYLAGKSSLKLLPRGIDVKSEILRDNAQVDNDIDTTIQVDWKFNATASSPKTENRWMYFQEGVTLLGFQKSDPRVIGRYTSNKDVAASVTPYGKGFVGLVGPHPEADESWYEDADIENPDGVQTDIGYDFVKSTLDGIQTTNSSKTRKAGS
ncbi:hypothetical protein FPOAC2_14112 [Fusarium poae]